MINTLANWSLIKNHKTDKLAYVPNLQAWIDVTV
jgi:hypothetical protein